MKISIITVCYNSADTIADTLQSVREQSHPDIEHIVVDGGSRDGTLAVVASAGPHVAKLLSEQDHGIYDAMNKGLALATGELVGFLNSDDVLAHANVIQVIAQAMADPAVDACYGDLVYVAQNDIGKVVRYWKSQDYGPGLFQRGWVPAHPTFYARRTVYQRYGGFDPEFRLAADFDILLRFFEACGIVSTYIPEVLVKMRLGGATNASFGNVIRQNREIAKSFRKYGLPAGLKPFAYRMLLRLPQFFRKPAKHG